MFIVQINNLFIKFMSGKTLTNISFENIRNTTLPAVTICPTAVDFSKLSLLNDNIWILYKQYIKMIGNASRSKLSYIEWHLIELYEKALKIYFNSTEKHIKMMEILNTLTPLFDKNNESLISAIFYVSSAYGKIDRDLIYSKNDDYFKLKSLPMESYDFLGQEFS